MPAKMKRILIVAVGDPSLSTAQQDALRPLIPSMKAAVGGLAAGTYVAKFDYAVAALGPGPNNQDLQDAIKKRLAEQKPDVILTIASAATTAARDVARNDPRAIGIPIVFTVVSEPEHEPHGDPFITPGTPRAERITGVSRGLVQSAREAVSRFKQIIDPNQRLHVHWIHRQGLHQSDRAHDRITNPLLPITHTQLHPRTSDCSGMVDEVKRMRNPSPQGEITALFLIPDDLVGSCAGPMIKTAHDPERKVPTLVQQLEWVCRKSNDPVGPPALAGYGVMPEWVGTKAGRCVHQVILNPDAAKTLPVLTPSEEDREFLINLGVAHTLGVPLAHPLPAWAKPCPVHAQPPAAPTKPKAARPTAAKASAKKPARRAGGRKATPARRARTKKRPAKAAKKGVARKGRSTARRSKKR